MATKVELTPREMIQAAFVGVMRRVEALQKGRNDRYGGVDQRHYWPMDVEGAMAEMALAKFLGVFWHGANRLGARDVNGFEVRWTWRENGSLLLHEGDDAGAKYALVTGEQGSYKIRGWIVGADGMREEYWRDPVGGRPAFFVPQSALTELPGGQG